MTSFKDCNAMGLVRIIISLELKIFEAAFRDEVD